MNFKSYSLSIFLAVFLISCSEKKDEPISELSVPAVEPIETIEEGETSSVSDLESHPSFQNWLGFYQTSAPEMSMGNFNLSDVQKLEILPGSVPGNFDPEFDETYAPFLIFNPSKTMYLDIDSYNWSVDNEGVAQFEADQEINLVDLKEKTVNRVAFFGPSYRIDDAFWVSDSIFVLLETGSDNRPGIMTYNLKDNSIYIFQHSEEISPSDKEYIQSRLEKEGLKYNP
ncbi:MAG: hypothetical protein GX159_07930 [Flavobacteriaceae bacterium]|jgi:hypothetical protein|nr:hypothetical protein [Flavobacteriaceae bacterium]